jgi:hypothetical protein
VAADSHGLVATDSHGLVADNRVAGGRIPVARQVIYYFFCRFKLLTLDQEKFLKKIYHNI